MKKILIVDDEEKIQNIYVRTFVEMGIVVRQARNAQEAINIVIRENIDLILLDIQMPLIDGRTVFDIIEEYNPQLKVIVSSVYPIDKQRLMVPRASGYYDKSEGMLKLLERVKLQMAI